MNILKTILFVFLTLHVSAQDFKKMSPKKMSKDLDQLMDFLEAHPDPFSNVSEEEFNSKLEQVKTSISDSLTLLEFYVQLSSLLAVINDGHTNMSMPKDWLEYKRKKHGVFPWEVHVSNSNEIFFSKNFDTIAQIAPGSKILSINGEKTTDLIDKLDHCISYEQPSFRNALIEWNFEHYLYTLFGTSSDLKFEVASIDTQVVSISTMNYRDWFKVHKKTREDRDKQIALGKPYNYEDLGNKIGLLSIYSFVGRLNEYQHFLSATFKSIAKDSIKYLVIDVRGNFGGWPKLSSELFHYLTEDHFKVMGVSQAKASRPYQNALRGFQEYQNKGGTFSQHNRHMIDVLGIVNAKTDSYLVEDQFYNEAPITKQNEFKGKIFLLVDRRSYSAASSFAATFKCYNMGLLVGEDTGGTTIFRANAISEMLLRSKLRMNISTTLKQCTCAKDELTSVTPHVNVEQTVLNEIHGIDGPINQVRMIVRKLESTNSSK